MVSMRNQYTLWFKIDRKLISILNPDNKKALLIALLWNHQFH